MTFTLVLSTDIILKVRFWKWVFVQYVWRYLAKKNIILRNGDCSRWMNPQLRMVLGVNAGGGVCLVVDFPSFIGLPSFLHVHCTPAKEINFSLATPCHNIRTYSHNKEGYTTIEMLMLHFVCILVSMRLCEAPEQFVSLIFPVMFVWHCCSKTK